MLQTTIKKSTQILGIGLHTGETINMRLEPAGIDEGVVFHRSDLDNLPIPAHFSSVSRTTMATSIGEGDSSISTVEHLMSAIYAYGVDNLKVFIDNIEVPVLDGSSQGFCWLLDEVGVVSLDAPKKLIKITKPVEVVHSNGISKAGIKPSDSVCFDYEIDFKHPSIGVQSHHFDFTKSSYITDIAKARTFGFLHDLHHLQSKGLARGGDMSNAIVLDEHKILNPEGLRYDNEFVRHKILDAIGDLALLGHFVVGGYYSFAGSHDLNYKLCQAIVEQDAYEFMKANNQTQNHTQAYALNEAFA